MLSERIVLDTNCLIMHFLRITNMQRYGKSLLTVNIHCACQTKYWKNTKR